jgi:DNA invertase Pin-like site-specific DNA recombinase
MRPAPPEDRQRIIDLYKGGMTRPAIARETGWSEGTVQNIIRASGIAGAGRVTGVRTAPEVEAQVMALYKQGAGWAEIMRQTGRTEHTVSAIIKRNGGSLGRKVPIKPEDRERIPAMYESGMDAPEIGRVLGCHSSSVYNVLQEAGMDRRERLSCDNPGYFDRIDAPDKAYWLGFIGADGCVSAPESGKARLQVKLARKDRDHLVLLHKALQARRPIRDDEQFSAGAMRPYSTLAVYSPEVATSLIALGITPRKTDTLEPWNGPSDLMPHYWRGLVDGDGHITINQRGVFTGLLGSKPVADAYAAWVNEVAGTNVHATPKKPSTTAWCVQIGGTRKVLHLLAALYDDAPVALARKKALADLAVHSKPLAATLF